MGVSSENSLAQAPNESVTRPSDIFALVGELGIIASPPKIVKGYTLNVASSLALSKSINATVEGWGYGLGKCGE
jgi:hypothetical protein